MSQTHKILIADDHPTVREGLKSILKEQNLMNVDLEFCKNGVEVLDLVSKNKFDLILLDITMPIISGLEALEKIRNELKSDVPVLMLTSHNDQAYIDKSFEHGAAGYFMKYEDADELIDAIKNVIQRDQFYNQQINHIIDSTANEEIKTSIPELSKHQRQILALIVQEKTSQEIADELFLSLRTIEGHRKRIMAKLNLTSTIGLVKYAIENGIK